MPQRFLRPQITNSERWNKVSFAAQSLFIRLLTLVDDFGRYDGRVSVIWGACFSVWNEQNPTLAVNPQETAALCQQCAAVGLLTFYESEGKKVVKIEQWNERTRSSTSKWPENKGNSQIVVNPLRNPAESCGILPPSPSPSPSPSPYGARARNGFVKPTIEELNLQMAKVGLPEAEAKKFMDWYESNGWKVGRNPMKSWVHAVSNWKARIDEKRYKANSLQSANGEIGSSL